MICAFLVFLSVLRRTAGYWRASLTGMSLTAGLLLPLGAAADLVGQEAAAINPRPVEFMMVLHYPSGSDYPYPEDVAQLRDATPRLAAWKILLIIEAHADCVGSRENNMLLSERRAENLVQIMTMAGMDRSLIHAFGVGEERPLVSAGACDKRSVSPETLAKARRAIVKMY
jgi:outer membrane protein OmpA-like peptidoglycan-associated protein